MNGETEWLQTDTGLRFNSAISLTGWQEMLADAVYGYELHEWAIDNGKVDTVDWMGRRQSEILKERVDNLKEVINFLVSENENY